MKLSIIIPIFNEEKTVDKILKKVATVKLPGIKKEIIVIDDGSADKTKQVLSELKIENLKLKILRHKKNLGKGAAIRSGLRNATGEIIIIQDADLEYDPAYIPALLKPILGNQTNIVYGSRLVNYPLKLWGKNKTVLPSHLIANKFLTGLTNLLFNSKLTDMETCYKIFKKKCLDGISLNCNGFEFEPEITAKFLKKGCKIFEVPIKVIPRTYDQGKKINFWDGIKAIWTILRFRFFD